MPQVTVDSVEIEVPRGATVLQACEIAGKAIARGGGVRGHFFLLLAAFSFPVIAAEKVVNVDGKIARQSARKFADCVVRKQPEVSVRFVIDREDFTDNPRQFSRLFNSDCLDIQGTLKLAPLSARAALAEALLRKETAGSQTADFSNVQPILRPELSPPRKVDKKGRPFKPDELAKHQEYFEKARVARALEIVAECAVRKNTAGVRAVLATEIGSKEEVGALRATASNVGACVDEGVSFKIEWEPLRSAMALTYFELLMAQKGRRWSPAPIRAGAGPAQARELLEAAE